MSNIILIYVFSIWDDELIVFFETSPGNPPIHWRFYGFTTFLNMFRMFLQQHVSKLVRFEMFTEVILKVAMVFVSLQSSETFFKQASLLVEDGLIGMSWHQEPSHMALQRIRWQSRFVAEVVI